ncbi:YfjI family protein [Marinobacter zhanjiangensis]|uniref:DUF3987 domain-containing protein n=1 Tax=Marinobacter zhanjiangensis TaxID=578215 RepID=A0ABQ3B9G7_9GAMM|nr:YfjI family protein [Marinobacter zhanjiangensis]GGY79912.1 hypothetical protein GCM10007071_29010 [Marinobacter zhanjiangensis]
MTSFVTQTSNPEPWVESVWSLSSLPRRDSPFPWHIGLPLFNALVDEAQSNVQAPRALIVNSALTALALAQQGLIDVRKPNGQRGPTSIMMLTIADSGERKSTVDNTFLDPIRKFQRKHKSRYEESLRKWQVEHDVWNTRRKALIKSIAKKASSGSSSTLEEQMLLENESNEPVRPKGRKLLYEDSTSEALFYELSQNWPTAGLVSSEGGGVLAGSALKDLSKQNAMWSGDSITVDRKSGQSYELVGARLTVSLMVQKSSFDKYMEKYGETSRGSGLWARFFVAQPPSTQGSRFITKVTQSWQHRDKFTERLNTLLEENVTLLEESTKEKQVVQFSSEASERWFEVANAIEAEIRPGGRFERAGDHASKLADNIARLAAHFHWFEGFEGGISRETLELAINTCFWYSNEFLRLFVPPPQELTDAHELNEWMIHIQMRGQRYIRRNYIRQYGPNRLRDKRRLETALDLLQIDGRISMFMMGKVACIDLRPWELYEPLTAQAVIFGQMRSDGS